MSDAFNGVGKDVGAVVWRIEKLKPVVVKTNGELYSGASPLAISRSIIILWRST